MKILRLFPAALMAVFLSGCAASIPITVQRPPALNTLGIQSMAVMPFETSDSSPLQRQAAALLTSEAQTRIQGTGQFTMIAPSQIEQYRRANESLINHVDSLFQGRILSLSVNEGPRQDRRYNSVTKEYYYVTIYEREVSITFEYYIIKTRDGSITGPIRRDGSTSGSSDGLGALDSAETMLRSIIPGAMNALARDVAPYTVTQNHRLKKEKSKDKDVKELAKNADALAKSGNLKAAQDAYLDIYRSTGSYTAAYNAGILIAALGDLGGAASFMQSVYNDTGNLQASAEAARLRREIETTGLAAAYSQNQGQRDKLIALMVDTLPQRLPQNAKIAIVNNSRSERELAETITNGIISGFLAKNITLVDRNNQTLVEMERNYQYSGNVSDDDMIRIGNEAGVNTFILVSVTGSFSTRRLLVRMLDVERNTILYQSPQTSEMDL